MAALDRIFDPHYAAVDLFTNRIPENKAFADAVRGQLERLLAGHATLAEPVRRNVLTFYGIGGIGKTVLSKRLEGWLLGELPETTDWGTAPVVDQSVRTARIDFHGSRVVDPVDVLLRLRAALAGQGRRFPAFDLGLTAWWALARPGAPLPETVTAGGSAVREQMVDTVGEVIGDAGLGLGLGPLSVRTGIRIVDAIRHRRLRGRLLNQCRPLLAITEEARRDPSPEVGAALAGLLSWDLDQLVRGELPLAVAFADALEYVQGRDRVQERLFNRIVYLTPAVLWVLTSQRSLDWGDPALYGVLPHTGPATWPGLFVPARGEPGQHLVGDLSDADILSYLNRASGTDGNPELGDEVIERIRRGSHGLPLYLDLSLAIARAAAGQPPDPELFGGPLPALVNRVFADLPEQERDIARTASLLPRFDPELVAQAAGRLEGDARRFCSRALVRDGGHPRFPYRLHDAVRSALADEIPSSPGAWTAADRLAQARAMLDTLRQRHEAALADVDCRLDLLQLAAGLCADLDIEASWLRRALVDLPGMARTADRLPAPDERTWIGQLSRFFEAWRQGRTTRQRIAYLEDLLGTPLPADIEGSARRFLAYAYRTVGEAEPALELLVAQLTENPDSSLLRYQIARTLHTLGRYAELDELLRDRPPQNPTEAQRLHSDLAFERGQLVEAMAGPAARARQLAAEGRHRIALENETAALWRACWAGRATVRECDDLITRADRYGMRLQMRSSLASKGVCLAGDDHAVRTVLAEAATIIEASSGRQGWREWTVELLHAIRVHDQEMITGVRQRWEQRRPRCTPNYRLVDRLFQYAGYPATYPPIPIDQQDADRRWHTIIATLVDRH